MRAPETIRTDRLVLRRPLAADADLVFARYATNPAVTRYVAWPTHQTVEDTYAFVAFSDMEWERWPAGPYLISLAESGTLVGGTGLAFETPYRASTGYVLAQDAWGKGYATEALSAMVEVARMTGVRRLYGICHADHAASAKVLAKGGFTHEALLRSYADFPNLRTDGPSDVLCYARSL